MQRVGRGDVSKSFRPPSKNLGGQAFGCGRTRILLTRMEDWEQVATVHGEFFGSIDRHYHHAGVRFIDPDWLVEIEADGAVES